MHRIQLLTHIDFDYIITNLWSQASLILNTFQATFRVLTLLVVIITVSWMVTPS